MEAMSGNPEAIARLIREARSVAVCSHINPDGDTLSCAAAMRREAGTIETLDDLRALLEKGEG